MADYNGDNAIIGMQALRATGRAQAAREAQPVDFDELQREAERRDKAEREQRMAEIAREEQEAVIAENEKRERV